MTATLCPPLGTSNTLLPAHSCFTLRPLPARPFLKEASPDPTDSYYTLASSRVSPYGTYHSYYEVTNCVIKFLSPQL